MTIDGVIVETLGISKFYKAIQRKDVSNVVVFQPKETKEYNDLDLPRKQTYYNLAYYAASIVDFKKFMANKEVTNPKDKVPALYHYFLELFSKKTSKVLPPYRPRIDYKIKLTYNNINKYPNIIIIVSRFTSVQPTVG